MPDPSGSELSPAALVRRLEAGEPIHVLDIRAPERLASGTVDLVPDDRFHNVPGSELRALADPRAAGLPDRAPIAVVCGHGNSSRPLAAHLVSHGLDARSLTGGVNAWMSLVIPRPLPAPENVDRLVQLDRIGKGALGYAIVSDGEALLVDPSRATATALDVVRDAGARVVSILDTHAHADYVSGGPGLARDLGVPYHLHPADLEYPYDGRRGTVAIAPVADGDVLTVGRLRATVVHTPGHTEGSVCLRLGDRAVLTGDLLFVESVGRPDLGGKTDAWAPVLWQSLERVRAEWPGSIEILPAHHASESERADDRSVRAPLAGLPVRNEPFAISDRDAFVDWIRSRAGSFPEEYRRIKAVNLGLEHPSPDELDELEAGRNQCALG